MSFELSVAEKSSLLTLNAHSSDEQILAAIDTFVEKCPRDAEAAALLSRVLADSGSRLNPEGDFVADVASTGGPSSLSTLVAPLLLRAAGAVVPKLGVPGRPAGGIDCLAQLPGYRTMLTLQEVSAILRSGGYAHFLGSGEIAPLDGRMFKLRQIHDAQAVPTLVTASLLSKKLAVGLVYAGLDVRVAPHGNFGTDWVTATGNARLFIEAAGLIGIKAFPVLTDGEFPYQPYIGRQEALIALSELFSGTASPWLDQHFQTCRLLALACTPEERRPALAAVTAQDLRLYFDQNLSDQGADPATFERVVETTKVLHSFRVLASTAGFVHYPLENIRKAMVGWQEQLASPRNLFPDPVGIILLRQPGTWVNKGEPVATFRAPNELATTVAEVLRKLISIPSDHPLAPGVQAIADE
jgi:pyrimidine-nucleoside phosphorylase